MSRNRKKGTGTFFKRGLSGLTAVALVASQLALPPHAEASHLGSSTASAGSVPPPSVSAIQSFQPDLFTGRATTAIPIAAPPGRKGMQPSLALSYSSSARNGWVGVGWSLDVGYLERSTKNGVPTYGSSDTFSVMLQGVNSDLVDIGSNEYRAKDEGLFLRFRNNGVGGWEVWDKSGTRYRFGQTAASQIEHLGDVFRWSLNQVIDTSGNTVTFTYAKDRGQLYLSQIRYTGHTSGTPTPANQVDFTLESRPDVETSYRGGFPVTTAKRLAAIEAKATIGTTLERARRYDLAYTMSGRTSRSLLASVTQVGADGVAKLPPATFTYQATDAPTYTLTANNPSTSTIGWHVSRSVQTSANFGQWSCNPSLNDRNWTLSTLVTSSGQIDCPNSPLSVTVNADGSFSFGGCDGYLTRASTWVYNAGPSKDLSLGYRCIINETTGIAGQSDIPLPSGWSKLHLISDTRQALSVTNEIDLMSPTQFTKPQLAGDADGNGITDLITFDKDAGTWSVALARSDGDYASSTLWHTGGIGGIGSYTIPLLGDWDGDGRTDIALFNDDGDSNWRLWKSNGTDFLTYLGSINLGPGVPGTTPLAGDFNGDGHTDIGTYRAGSWEVALVTDKPRSAPSFNRPLGSSAAAPLTGDWNGDGLTDIGALEGGSVTVALSDGRVFQSAGTWLSGVSSGPMSSADFNGDGLTDLARYDKTNGRLTVYPSTGEAFDSTPITPNVTFSLRGTEDQLQVGEFNGDGLADPAVFNATTGKAELARSAGTSPDLLSAIANGLGATTTLTYQPSTRADSATQIPFVLPLISAVTVDDGLGHAVTTRYSYQQGRYDGGSKEFRGFGRVEVRDAEDTVAITLFHQDELMKGRPSLQEVRDAAGNLWTKSVPTWAVDEPYAGVRFVKLDQTEASICDGDTICRTTQSRFEYDRFGNVTRTEEQGEAGVGDERTTQTVYAVDTTAWIVGTPSLLRTLDAGGALVAQRRFAYDATGRLTKEEEWLKTATGEQWLPTSLTYDAYGNVLTVTDALGRTTTNTYDATGTYLVKITNALGHSRTLEYDPRFGAVTRSIDPNGQATATEYDALGRVTKVIGPTDTAALPAARYEYTLASPISKTTACARIQFGGNEELCTHTFTDGLGRTIQTRSPSEDATKQIVSGAVELNSRGLVAKQWVPYLATASASYVPFSLEPSASTLASVAYTYDAMGRLLTTTDPDGSVTKTAYQDGTVTSTDANGNQTHRSSDAYGRLVSVEEVDGLKTYTTRYAYDALGNLLQVTDHAGNVTRLTYDSLGRKVAMDDPDMGRWTYAYDAVDNLKTQTDARGVVISFAYDALNRLTQKSYAIPTGSGIASPGSVTYTYDDPAVPFSKGKLTKVVDGSGSATFTYDALGRPVKETKTVDGTSYPVTRATDLLGRLTALTYPDGEVAKSTYNARGSLATLSLQPTSGAPQPIVTAAAYTAAGQLSQLTYGNGVTTTHTYDPQTLRLSTLRTTGPTGTLQDFSYAFDKVGNITEIVDRIHTGSQAFTYDGLHRLTRAVGSYGDARYAYDPLGNLTSKEDRSLMYGAGAAGPHAVTSTSDGLTLTYDANGNVTEKRPASCPASGSCAAAQTFKYDAENRLVEVTSPKRQTMTLSLKPGWNLISLPITPDNAAISAIFPSFAQDLAQISRRTATGTWEHHVGITKFDQFSTLEAGVAYEVYAQREVTVTLSGSVPANASRLLSTGWHLLPALIESPATPAAAFAGLALGAVLGYDTDSRSLTSVTTVSPGQSVWVQVTNSSTWTPPGTGSLTTRFVYDGDGGKVKRIDGGKTTVLLGELLEIAPDGTTTKYLFVGSQRVASKTSKGELRFFHGDHLGSTNVVTDATGQVVERTEHAPFGAISAHTGTSQAAHGFTGQRQDPNHGLVLFPARAYDPDLGRFLQPDPFVQDPSDPQTLNRYTYVRNNPVNLVDPSGHIWFIAALLIAAVKAAVVGAVVGAAVNASVAAIRGEDIGQAAWRGARAGAASGALLGAGGFAIGAQGLALAGTAKTLTEVGIAAASGAVGGGVESRLQGGSFSNGLLPGAAGGVLGYGVSRAFGALASRWGLPTPEPGATGQQLGLMQSFRQWLSKAGSGATTTSDDAFQTVLHKVDALDFATGSNQAVFYSGVGQKVRAEAFARATGRMTIGMTRGGQQLMSDPLFQSLSSNQQYLIWQKASVPFTKGASGKINAFIKGAKPTGTFRSIEEPILDENPYVYGRRYW